MFKLKYLKKKKKGEKEFFIEILILLELLLLFIEENIRATLYTGKRNSCDTFRSMIFPPSPVFFNFEKSKC